MKLYNQVDKFFWNNTIGNKAQPGIFIFDDVSDYIKSSIKKRDNLGSQKFIQTMKDQNKYNLDYFIDLIHQETNEDQAKIEKVIDKRLLNAFIGLFGEAILESMYGRSNKYTVIPITKEDDYSLRIDLKIKQNSTQRILNFQVKSSSFYNSPTDYHLEKIKNEKRIHEENSLVVSYAFYNHSFQERYFMIEENMIPIYGYGNSNVAILESITDLIFKTKDNLQIEEITKESIIF
ncbi:hypothetical protein [Staphylococcus equorum]|uniref:Uncharacterized protein n=1 Tax=Staphylococcus equorum TaxID=246432 RepID=A0A9X4R2Y2_9STAP|nr:hypothetical protein [Staphylococcus equorum]MDG0860399.1 hypothetical protein [Staphylococcus equorum]